MTLRNRILSIMAVACVISFLLGTALCEAAATKVIGMATVKKGATLGGFAGGSPFVFEAFKDQEFYIIKKVEPRPGVHNGGYVIDADGFSHNCPTHGEEVIPTATIGIPIEMVNDGDVDIVLFEQALPNTKEGQ